MTALAEAVTAGLDSSGGSGLLAIAERARAAGAWLASVELEAVSRLLRLLTREGQEESEELARAARRSPPTVEAAAGQGEGWGWDWTVGEAACAFRMTSSQADARVGLASTLRDLPRVHELLRAGQIDEYRARVIAEGLSASALSPADAAWSEVESQLCAKAPDRTGSQLRAHLRRLLLAIDPEAVARRRQAAIDRREVRAWAEADGMGVLEARLTAETVAVIDTCLNAMADAARDRTDPSLLSKASGRQGDRSPVAGLHQQRRADALARCSAPCSKAGRYDWCPCGRARRWPPPNRGPTLPRASRQPTPTCWCPRGGDLRFCRAGRVAVRT